MTLADVTRDRKGTVGTKGCEGTEGQSRGRGLAMSEDRSGCLRDGGKQGEERRIG